MLLAKKDNISVHFNYVGVHSLFIQKMKQLKQNVKMSPTLMLLQSRMTSFLPPEHERRKLED